jgi:hypothetical protein
MDLQDPLRGLGAPAAAGRTSTVADGGGGSGAAPFPLPFPLPGLAPGAAFGALGSLAAAPLLALSSGGVAGLLPGAGAEEEDGRSREALKCVAAPCAHSAQTCRSWLSRPVPLSPPKPTTLPRAPHLQPTSSSTQLGAPLTPPTPPPCVIPPPPPQVCAVPGGRPLPRVPAGRAGEEHRRAVPRPAARPAGHAGPAERDAAGAGAGGQQVGGGGAKRGGEGGRWQVPGNLCARA